MDKEKIVIIVILSVFFVMCLFNYFVLSENNKTININEIEVKVPDTNNTVIDHTEHYSTYEDIKNGIVIYVFDSKKTSLNDAEDMFRFINARDVNQLETISIEEDDYRFNYSKSLNEYTYLSNRDDKNIFVITKDKEDLMKIIKSMKFKSTKRNESDSYQEDIIENTVNSHPSLN